MTLNIAENQFELTSSRRKPISAFVVCFNEEENIGDCLESLKFCDEILVIDSFSTDRTVEIAKSYGARVIEHAWPGYREQKSFGLGNTTNEWVINIDADERVSPELRENILKIMESAQSAEDEGKEYEYSGFEVSRVVYFLGRWWRLGGWYPEYRVRLLRKSRTVWGGTNPHEKPIVTGKIGRPEGELEHYTYEDIDDQLKRLHSHAAVAAKEDLKHGKKVTLRHLIFNPVMRFVKFYFIKRGYREGMAGLIVGIFEGYYTFIKYAKVWEGTLNSKDEKNSERK